MNLFVLLWTQRWCKLCLFIPVRMTLFCKINNDKKKTTKKRKKRKKRKMKLSVMSWSFPEKYTGSSELELFFISYDYHHYILFLFFFFSCVFLFCWLIQDKHCTAPSLSPLYSVLSSSSSLPPSSSSPPFLCLPLLLPSPSLPISLFFLSSLHLCNANVLYVVIKQCQTQKLFINNIKQKVSSNGWGGLCLPSFCHSAYAHLSVCVCVCVSVANRQTSRMGPEAEW